MTARSRLKMARTLEEMGKPRAPWTSTARSS